MDVPRKGRLVRPDEDAGPGADDGVDAAEQVPRCVFHEVLFVVVGEKLHIIPRSEDVEERVLVDMLRHRGGVRPVLRFVVRRGELVRRDVQRLSLPEEALRIFEDGLRGDPRLFELGGGMTRRKEKAG